MGVRSPSSSGIVVVVDVVVTPIGVVIAVEDDGAPEDSGCFVVEAEEEGVATTES